ncbi:MAG: hypothetical protein ABSG44_19530 [Thermodesulfobacteriota bacterium]
MFESELPEPIQKIKNDIEKLSGASVRFKEDSGIDGAMKAEIENGTGRPIIKYQNEKELCDGGVAEELMHLNLDYSGYPRIFCPENEKHAFQAADILHNVLQHSIIFPQLESLGYNPRDSEYSPVENALKIIESADFKRLPNEPYLRAMFAVAYVRSKLFCQDNIKLQEHTDQIFEDADLVHVKKMAQEVIEKVKNLPGKSKAEYIETLDHCLSELKLSEIVSMKIYDIAQKTWIKC